MKTDSTCEIRAGISTELNVHISSQYQIISCSFHTHTGNEARPFHTYAPWPHANLKLATSKALTTGVLKQWTCPSLITGRLIRGSVRCDVLRVASGVWRHSPAPRCRSWCTCAALSFSAMQILNNRKDLIDCLTILWIHSVH
jgi:hypothetical protein